jgi:AmmeMemoRadiSam system protein B/AmmeMemoRadiSam system protein A
MKLTIRIISFYLLYSAYSLCNQTIFQAHLSNEWYPSNKKILEQKLQDMSAQASKRFFVHTEPNDIVGAITPHAGYTFSGHVASSIYKLISQSKKKNIIILAPSHHIPLKGIALLSSNAYKTPLGIIPIQKTIYNKIAALPFCTYNNNIFAKEHSLEMQIPLIQWHIPNAKIIPLIIGNITKKQRQKIASLLKSYLPNAVIIATSDFTHHGEKYKYSPFKSNVQDNIRQLDSYIIQPILNNNPSQFLKNIKTTKASICGSMPISVLLDIARSKKLNAELAAHTTSYEITGEQSPSVSYASIFFTHQKKKSLPLKHQLTQYEKNSLITLAYKKLHNLFEEKPIKEKLLYPILTPSLEVKRGAFVTLEKNGALRGCIGKVISNQSLYKTIADMTKTAALYDSRFSPVTKKELPQIKIKISVLTQPKPIKQYQDIIIGKHGIIIKHKNKSALFLPSVAPDNKWDLETTLSFLSEKAGLSRNAWKNPNVKFSVFESDDFEQTKTGLSQ